MQRRVLAACMINQASSALDLGEWIDIWSGFLKNLFWLNASSFASPTRLFLPPLIIRFVSGSHFGSHSGSQSSLLNASKCRAGGGCNKVWSKHEKSAQLTTITVVFAWPDWKIKPTLAQKGCRSTNLLCGWLGDWMFERLQCRFGPIGTCVQRVSWSLHATGD